MFALLEKAAEEKWKDQADENLREQIDLKGILERGLEFQERMESYLREELRTIDELSHDTRSILESEGCIPEFVEELLH